MQLFWSFVKTWILKDDTLIREDNYLTEKKRKEKEKKIVWNTNTQAHDNFETIASKFGAFLTCLTPVEPES